MSYIEKEKAISAVCFRCNQLCSEEPCEPSECFIRQAIECSPTADVVEVVRCKDCVARCNTKLEPFRCERNNILVYGNSFCSYGKRREE